MFEILFETRPRRDLARFSRDRDETETIKIKSRGRDVETETLSLCNIEWDFFNIPRNRAPLSEQIRSRSECNICTFETIRRKLSDFNRVCDVVNSKYEVHLSTFAETDLIYLSYVFVIAFYLLCMCDMDCLLEYKLTQNIDSK